MIKRLLLGSTVMFIGLSSAQAADPVIYKDYSEPRSLCNFGDGYFSIGGNNCLEISGRARFVYKVDNPDYYVTGRLNVKDDELSTDEDDISVASDRNKELDFSNLSASGRVDFNVLSATELGVLRGFIRIEDTGITKAYSQLYGLTAGKTDSFFGFSEDLGADEAAHFTGGWDDIVPLLAYSASPIEGLVLTASIEKREDTGIRFGTASAGLDRNISLAFIENSTASSLLDLTNIYRLPDFVADAEYTQDWGKVGLSAALTGTRIVDPGDNSKELSNQGFAVAGGAKVYVPGIDGLSVTARGTWAKGAGNYLGLTDSNYLTFKFDEGSTTDGEFVLEAISGWDAGAGVTMEISENLEVNVAASYASFNDDQASKIDMRHSDYSSCDSETDTTADCATKAVNASADSVAANTQAFVNSRLLVSAGAVWKPVTDLAFGLEAYYGQNKLTGYGLETAGDQDTAFSESENAAYYGGSLTVTRTW